MFVTPEEIMNQSALDDRSRLIIVSNSKYIETPGLLWVDAVSIDGVNIPLEDERPMYEMAPAAGDALGPVSVKSVPVPMVQVMDVPTLGTVLARSQYSNFGEWQIGSRVIVTGEWAERPVDTFVPASDIDAVQAEKQDLEKEMLLLEAENKKLKAALERSQKAAAKGAGK